MDIKRDEAFEEAYAEICKPIIRRPYPRNQNGEYVYKEIHEAHLMWQQAQKVTVPEGFVLVPSDTIRAIHFSSDLALDSKAVYRSALIEVRDALSEFAEKIEAQE